MTSTSNARFGSANRVDSRFSPPTLMNEYLGALMECSAPRSLGLERSDGKVVADGYQFCLIWRSGATQNRQYCEGSS